MSGTFLHRSGPTTVVPHQCRPPRWRWLPWLIVPRWRDGAQWRCGNPAPEGWIVSPEPHWMNGCGQVWTWESRDPWGHMKDERGNEIPGLSTPYPPSWHKEKRGECIDV